MQLSKIVAVAPPWRLPVELHSEGVIVRRVVTRGVGVKEAEGTVKARRRAASWPAYSGSARRVETKFCAMATALGSEEGIVGVGVRWEGGRLGR